MTDEVASGKPLHRTKVLVITDRDEFVGYLHTMVPDRRETDVLNDERTFIHLTDVVFRVKGDLPKKVDFVAVNKANIICVIPEEEFLED